MHAPLNLRSIIQLVMLVWSRENINEAAVVTMVSFYIMLLHDVLVLQVQQIRFLSHWDPYAVLSLELVASSLYCRGPGAMAPTEPWLTQPMAPHPISCSPKFLAIKLLKLLVVLILLHKT